jgi:hypothetical protein
VAVAETPTAVVRDHWMFELTVRLSFLSSDAVMLALTETLNVCDCCEVKATLAGVSRSFTAILVSLTPRRVRPKRHPVPLLEQPVRSGHRS